MNKYIRPAIYKSDTKSDEVEKSEQKPVKSVGERAKMRKQKSDELNEMITEKDEIIDKKLLKNYFHQFENLSDMQKKLSQTQNAQKK